MGIKYIRDYYKVPAKIGGLVLYNGRPGVIVAGYKQYLRIRLDGEKRSGIYHPTYLIEYLPAQQKDGA